MAGNLGAVAPSLGSDSPVMSAAGQVPEHPCRGHSPRGVCCPCAPYVCSRPARRSWGGGSALPSGAGGSSCLDLTGSHCGQPCCSCPELHSAQRFCALKHMGGDIWPPDILVPNSDPLKWVLLVGCKTSVQAMGEPKRGGGGVAGEGFLRASAWDLDKSVGVRALGSGAPQGGPTWVDA